MPYRIGVDLMGGDGSPVELFQAVVQAVDQLPAAFDCVAIATPEAASQLCLVPRVTLQIADDFICMEDSPLYAVRTKKGASLVVGVQALRDRTLDALVSVGNTGALIASASLYLSKRHGIDRLALLAVLPTTKGMVAVLDVGGTVAGKAPQLVQFASMGASYLRSLGVEKPKVGLLNIGTESKKGTHEHQRAFQMLQQVNEEFEFVGNVEGREVFAGKVDVLVTDGFTGNVFLKTSEGVSAFILDFLRDSSASPQLLHALHSQVDYDRYPGAVVCGVDAVVIKCHGYSSAKALLNGILGAANLLERKWPRA